MKLRLFKNFRISRQLKRANLVSPPLNEEVFEELVAGQKTSFTHSSFNVNWIAELGYPADVLLELGSFDGGDGYRFRQQFKDAKIVSVEADPDRFDIVSRNLSETGNIIINCAVCDSDGEIDWFTASVDGKSHAQGSLFRQTEKYKKRFDFVKQATVPVKVTAKRIDTLCRELEIKHVDVLHMDIEGAERLALLGLGDLRPDLIYLEMRDNFFEGAGSSVDTAKILKELGYSLVVNLGTDRLYHHTAKS